jgi:hypothetical protein
VASRLAACPIWGVSSDLPSTSTKFDEERCRFVIELQDQGTITLLDRGHFLPGGTLLGIEGGVNETYRGMVEVPVGRISAYVKLLTKQQFCNEVIAHELARRAGLKIPDAYVVMVNQSDYPLSKAVLATGGSVIGFASADVGIESARKIGIDTLKALAALFASWKEWPEVAAFDDWIANIDRNTGNFLVGARGDVWIIDHGHAFTGPTWTIGDLDPTCSCTNKLCAAAGAGIGLPEKYSAFSRAVQIQSTFGAIDTNDAVGSVGISGALSIGELSALKSFVRQRIPSVHERLAALLGIPVLGAGVTP